MRYNVFQKLIVTFRRVPWRAMLNYAGDAGDGITQDVAVAAFLPNALCNMCRPTPAAGQASVKVYHQLP